MENETLNKPDRVLITLLTLSVVANVVLAILMEQSSAVKAALEQKLNHSDSISTADMARLISDHPPTLGRLDAPITLVLFEDFQCPYCRQFSAALKQLDPDQKRQMRIVFRQFPLPVHRFAHNDAELTACAARQSDQAFWALYDYLYSQTNLQKDPMYGAMQLLKDSHNVNMSELSSCILTHQADGTIDRDIALGQTYGVHGTPTMFINGRRLSGSPQDLGSLLRSVVNQP